MSNDTNPSITFFRLDCPSCEARYALRVDIATGCWYYYNARYVPQHPPMYTIAGTPTQCPNPHCNNREMEIKSTLAVVTSEGHWLYLDKAMGVG